jgi:GNAT superfamily N-acetyltransferase
MNCKNAEYKIYKISEVSERIDEAAEWFNSKWGVPKEAYLESMEDTTRGGSYPEWYIASLGGGQIIGGLGVIENDFHDRTDLAPNVCAVFVEPDYRCQGIAGALLNFVYEDMKAKGVSPIYLLTDHDSFYERYGWEFYCMAQGDGEDEPSRLYIKR